MTNYKNRAEALRDELIQNRRTLHAFAETGFDLPQTTAFVEQQLRSYGLKPIRYGRPAHAGGIRPALCRPEWALPLLRA